MKKLIISITLCAHVALSHAAQWPAGYTEATSVNDADPVMIAQSGVMKKAPASLLRQILSTNITDSTATGRSLLTVASVSAARTALGLAIGSDVQAYSAKLAAFSGLTGAANKGVYFTGADTLALFDLSTFARTLLDDADAVAMRATLGLVIGTDVQAFNAKLAAIAAATQAADTLFYYTGATAGTSTTLTSYGRSLIDDADAAAARTTLGLVIGTNVQPYHANLAAIAGGTWTGASSITTLGTIGTGTWQGTAIAPTYMTAATATTLGIERPANNGEIDARSDAFHWLTPAAWARILSQAQPVTGAWSFTNSSGAVANTWQSSSAVSGAAVFEHRGRSGTSGGYTRMGGLTANFGVSYGMFSDSNLDFSANGGSGVINLVGAPLITGNVTANGTSNTIPNQTMPTDAHTLNKGLGKQLIMEEVFGGFYEVNPISGSSTFTGTGAINPLALGFRLNTGSTNSSSALWVANSNAIQRFFRTDGSVGIQWSRPIDIQFQAQPATISDTTIRLQFGRYFTDTTVGDLAYRGVGVNITNGAVTLEVHDGTTRSVSSTLTTLSLAKFYKFRIHSEPSTGIVTLFIDGVQVGTKSNGPIADSGTEPVAIGASIQNTAGADKALDITQIFILVH